jgi:hypothetical protein
MDYLEYLELAEKDNHLPQTMRELNQLLGSNNAYYAQFYVHGMTRGLIFDLRGGPDAEPVVHVSAPTLADMFEKLLAGFKEYKRGQ